MLLLQWVIKLIHKNGETETAKGAEKSSVLSFFELKAELLVDMLKKNPKLNWMEIFPFGKLIGLTTDRKCKKNM